MAFDIPSQRRVAAFYGSDAQAMVHCEELAELIQAISKVRRAKNSGKDAGKASDNHVEEMADVLICLSQMQTMYDIPDHAIQDMIYRKCARQEARLNDAH